MLKVKKLHPNAKLPTKNKKNDAGYDLYALEDVYIVAGEITKIRTGIALELPSNTVGLLWDRSGLGSKGIHCVGGVIDEGYRGEILVCLTNLRYSYVAQDSFYKINAGDKIIQLIIHNIDHHEVVEVDELSSTERGEKGFGSSGK